VLPAALLFSAAFPQVAPAQVGGAGAVKIEKIQPAGVKTPDFEINPSIHPNKAGQWLEVEVEFASDAEFKDELTFKYHILIEETLLVGEVTHINIPKGRELRSVMYISPRNIERVLKGKTFTPNAIKDVGVQILDRGALVAEKSFKSSARQWWQSMQQTPGMVLNKSQTPFAPLFWDRYEEIKPAGR
jgi:hypothetical protein